MRGGDSSWATHCAWICGAYGALRSDASWNSLSLVEAAQLRDGCRHAPELAHRSLPESKAEEKRVDDALCKHKIGSHEDTIFTDDPVHCFFHAFLDAWACTGFPMKHLHIFAICLDIKNGYATTI